MTVYLCFLTSPHLGSIKEPDIQSPAKELFWDISLPSSGSVGFLNSHILCFNISSLGFISLSCSKQSKLDSVANSLTYILLPEKAMAPHSSTLVWKSPWTEEPGRLQSMGSLGVRHDWGTSLSLFTFMHWRRKWQPTPVFLPGESQGWGSLVGCHLWGCTELDMTEAT